MEPRQVIPGDDSWNRERDLPPRPADFWTRTNVGENLPFPVTPLTETAMLELFRHGEDNPAPAFQATRRFYGRLYFNEGGLLQQVVEEWGLPAGPVQRMWGSKHRTPLHLQGRLRPLRLLRRLLQALAPRKGGAPRMNAKQFFAQVDQWVSDFNPRELERLEDRALWAAFWPVWSERMRRAFAINLRLTIPAGVAYALLERMVGRWTGQKELAHGLVTLSERLYSAEVGPALWKMSETLRTAGLDPKIGLAALRESPAAEPFLEQLGAFLARHGHRCANELELLNPRWAEAPEQVLQLLSRYTAAPQRGENAAAIAQVEQSLGSLRRALFRKLLRGAQDAVTLRDNSRYTMARLLFPIRAFFALLGRRWAERGWLAAAGDVFFLTVSELEKLASSQAPDGLRALVARRREAYAHWLQVVAPDALFADGTPVKEEAAQDARALKGLAVSAGQARGRARIVHDVQQALQLQPGDILVTRATDPGWTPVFPLVSGIVLEIGGQLSHGAIVAREYAIPAVASVTGAMRAIRDGETIVVDGTGGRVLREGGGG